MQSENDKHELTAKQLEAVEAMRKEARKNAQTTEQKTNSWRMFRPQAAQAAYDHDPHLFDRACTGDADARERYLTSYEAERVRLDQEFAQKTPDPNTLITHLGGTAPSPDKGKGK